MIQASSNKKTNKKTPTKSAKLNAEGRQSTCVISAARIKKTWKQLYKVVVVVRFILK